MIAATGAGAVIIGASALGAATGAAAAGVPLAVLNSDPSKTTALSDEALEGMGNGGVEREAVVDLGSNDEGVYWTATDRAGNICVITLVPATQLVGATCTEPAVFATQGAGLAVSSLLPSGEMASNEMYLVPDDVTLDATATGRAGLVSLTPNLLVGSTDATKTELLTIGQSDGSAFEIPLFNDQ